MTKIAIIALTIIIPTLVSSKQGIYLYSSGGCAGLCHGNDVAREYLGPDGSYRGSAERDDDGWTFKNSSGGYAGSSSGLADRNPFGDSED